MSEDIFRKNLAYFIENVIKIKNNPKEASFEKFSGTFNGVRYTSSFGKGGFANVPWIAFLGFKQEVSKGIYPVILYNTKTNYNNFEICYGVSSYNKPNSAWDLKFISNLQHSKTTNYKESFIKSAYTINSVDDLKLNIQNIQKDLINIIEDFKENFYNHNEKNSIDNNFHFYADKKPIKQEDFLSANTKVTDKTINQPKNQILYGPPGTGKTYSIQEYIQNLLSENPGLNINSEEQKLNDIVKDLSWYTTIAISMYLNGKQNKYKVSDLMNQKIIKAFALTRENKNLRAALWAQMQIHTPEDCKTVNYTNRQAPFVFEKNENSEWCLTEDGIKYVEENLADQIAQYKAPSNTRKIEDFYKFITFHQSYSYEEFVEGIKPKIDVNDDSSTISYEYNRGIFKEICQQANSDPDNKYLLIIDEINRGNISKIFGELITLIETNKRVCPNKERNFENTKVDKEQLLVTLPYTKSKFGVPSNLYILGTMNTSDRSIASIDIALRRRFKFVEMMPRPEKLVDENKQPLMVGAINLQNLLKTINERISYILDRDHQIGHSYFMNWKNYDMTTLKNVWFDEIIPLLNEYFYSDWDKLQAILGKANEIGAEKSFIVKIKKPNLPYEADCSDEEAYYNFSKKEETNDDDFNMMLENAKLV